MHIQKNNKFNSIKIQKFKYLDKKNTKEKMDLWIELQNHQNTTRDIILKNLQPLSKDTLDSELLLKSEDFLQVFLTTITSWNQLCDISFKFILKILVLTLKKNISDKYFYKRVLDQGSFSNMKESIYDEESDKFIFEENSNEIFKSIERIGVINQNHFTLIMLFLEKNIEKFNKNFEFFQIFISILSKIKGSYRDICTLGVIKRIEEFIRLKIFDKNFSEEIDVFKLYILVLKLRIELTHQNFDISLNILKNLFKKISIEKLKSLENEHKQILKFWIDFFFNKKESKEKLIKEIANSYVTIVNLIPDLDLKVKPNIIKN